MKRVKGNDVPEEVLRTKISHLKTLRITILGAQSIRYWKLMQIYKEYDSSARHMKKNVPVLQKTAGTAEIYYFLQEKNTLRIAMFQMFKL